MGDSTGSTNIDSWDFLTMSLRALWQCQLCVFEVWFWPGSLVLHTATRSKRRITKNKSLNQGWQSSRPAGQSFFYHLLWRVKRVLEPLPYLAFSWNCPLKVQYFPIKMLGFALNEKPVWRVQAWPFPRTKEDAAIQRSSDLLTEESETVLLQQWTAGGFTAHVDSKKAF